jgi:poly(3-hydroxybutyrate) depolymerase
VRAASRNFDEWPTISVWHGSDDLRSIHPSRCNRQTVATLHGAEEAPTRTDIANGYPRRVWCDSGDGEVIEEYRIPNMVHGAPLQTKGVNGYARHPAE